MKKWIWISLGVLAFLSLIAGGLYYRTFGQYGPGAAGKPGAPTISHSAWTQLLHQYVNEAGMVDYTAFQHDTVALNAYLDLLSENPPAPDWPEPHKIAYWINAYNAFTVQVILRNYPLESIRELHSLALVNTIWHQEFFQIGGQVISLNQIEHGILREEFVEPRIHFAINCASLSCPRLRTEAYTAGQLDQQLTDQAKRFLAEPLRNRISPEKAAISKIFSWFSGDFTRSQSLIEFLNRYAPVPILPEAEISYLPYDWSLNDQAKHDLMVSH